MNKELFAKEDKELKISIQDANKSVKEQYINTDNVKQGSKAWFNMRLGKFTGSKFPDLMKKGRGKEEWGLTALKVIRKVYIERDLTDIGAELYVDELFAKRFRQTEWGNKYESDAISVYQEETGHGVDQTCFKLHPKFKYIGGSFDGDVVKENKIIEVKCPYDILVHSENVELQHDGIDSKHAYYGQIQGNIFVAGVESCDFVSYDPRRKNDNIVIINVKRDEAYINSLLERIQISELAISYMESGIDTYGAVLLAENDYKEKKEI